MGERGTAEVVDLRDGEGREIDLRERLRFAAGSLAADFGDRLTADHAEALVFSSAEGLLARASVMDFVPILAERRARLAIRAGASPKATALLAAPPPAPTPLPPPPAPTLTAPPPSIAATTPPLPAAGSVGATPLVAVPATAVSGLRDRVDRTRVRVSDWRAELKSR